MLPDQPPGSRTLIKGTKNTRRPRACAACTPALKAATSTVLCECSTTVECPLACEKSTGISIHSAAVCFLIICRLFCQSLSADPYPPGNQRGNIIPFSDAVRTTFGRVAVVGDEGSFASDVFKCRSGKSVTDATRTRIMI